MAPPPYSAYNGEIDGENLPLAFDIWENLWAYGYYPHQPISEINSTS